ncbi:MAG TPA: hypothetical protein VD995_20290 [Azospirillum sp.]|nr:hypothetical protein [Azospirillum sp.]
MLAKFLTVDRHAPCPFCGRVVLLWRGECVCGGVPQHRPSALGWIAMAVAGAAALLAAHTTSHLFHDGAMDPADTLLVVLCWLVILAAGAVAWKTRKLVWAPPPPRR